MGDFDSIFDILDQISSEALSSETPEENLIDAYFEFFNKVKLRVGTSSGYTGLSEYLFFQCIKHILECKTGNKLEAKKKTSDTYVFESDSMLLTHDININSVNNDLPNQKTDIAIFKKNNDLFILLGAFQIKAYISDPQILENEISKLKDLISKSQAYIFQVMFKKQYVDKLEEFCKGSGGRGFIISKSKMFKKEFSISLKDAIDKITKTAS